MSRITLPGRKPLLLPGTNKRALRRPNGTGLVVPQLSGEPLSANEVDYDELDILRQWREYSPTAPDEVRYFCYELEQVYPGETEADRYFKVVRLIRLTRVPRYLRQQSTSEEFRDILSSLREKKILFLNIIAKSPKLPLVFAYGVQGVGDTLAEAMERADEAYAALTVALDGSYQQLEYKPLSVSEGELLARYQNEWRHIAMARGRPLPENAGSGASAILDGNRTDVQQVNDAISSFIRGMGDKSFMMSLVTVPLSPEDMSHAWRNISVKLSAVRSDQQGSRSVGASFAIPLGLGASLGEGSGTTHGLTGTTGTGASDGLSASQTQGMSVSHADTTSLSETQGVSVSETQGVSASQSIGESFSETLGGSASETFGASVSENAGVSASANEGTSVSYSEGASQSLSQATSDSVSSSVTDSLSRSTSVGESVSTGQSFSTSQGTTDSLSVSESVGLTNTHSQSQSASVSQGQSLGVSNSAGSNWSQSVGQGLTASQTLADSWSRSMAESLNQTWGLSASHTDAFNRGSSFGGNASLGAGIESLGLNAALGETWSNNLGANYGSGFGTNLSQTGGATSTSGVTSSMSNALSNSFNLSETAGGSLGQSVTGTNSVSHGQSATAGQSLGVSQTHGVTQGTSMSSSATQGTNFTQGTSLTQGQTAGQSVGQSVGQTLSHGVGIGTSATAGLGTSQGTAVGTSQGVGAGLSQSATQGASHSIAQSVSTGSSVGASQSATQGASHSVSQGASSTDSVGANASATQGASTGVSSQQAVSDAWMVAMSRQAAQTSSFGIMPGLNATISKATFDEGKRALGDILEAQMRRYQDGIEGGGLLYQLFLTTEDRETLAGASSLLRASFWGPGDSNKGRLVQPFHTIIIEDEEERERLLTHAAALTHYRKREPVMDLIEPHLYSSYVTPGEASVFSSPPTSEAIGLMAQVDSMPVFAMPADRADRDMHLGHVVNGERGRVSDTRFGVDLNELTHILIQGTTGMGKTTTMMRLLEQASTLEREIIIPPTPANPTVSVKSAKAGILCFDWMENMRDLANVVPANRFQLFSVSQPELGAFRWNPLEIPHPDMPAHQWLGAQADQLAASFGLGEMGRSLIAEYIDQLYMANRLEPFVLRPAQMDEGVILRREIVLPAIDRSTLPPGAIKVDETGREIANVYTCSELSRLVSLSHIATMVVSLVEELATPEGARAQGTAMRDRVQSLWRRIQYYAPGGPLADMVAADPDLNTRECLGVRDIIDPERGLVTVIETDGLEQGSRRVILGSVMLAIYRYGLHVGKGAFDHGGKGPGTFLVMEEAHELFGTVDEGEDRDSVSMRVNLYESMFRRARATGLRLVAMTQNCGAIPSAITSQTTTVIVHRTYDSADRSRISDLFSWDRSMVGQIREIRYLGEMPKGYAIVRLDAQNSFLESAPVQILVDPPAIPMVTTDELKYLAQTRVQRLNIGA